MTPTITKSTATATCRSSSNLKVWLTDGLGSGNMSLYVLDVLDLVDDGFS